MTGSSFWGANCQGLKIVSSEPLASAFERSKPLPEKAGWPGLPVLGERLSDKNLLPLSCLLPFLLSPYSGDKVSYGGEDYDKKRYNNKTPFACTHTLVLRNNCKTRDH